MKRVFMVCCVVFLAFATPIGAQERTTDLESVVMPRQVSVGIGDREIKVDGIFTKISAPAYISQTGNAMLPLRDMVDIMSEGKGKVSWVADRKEIHVQLFPMGLVTIKQGQAEMEISGVLEKMVCPSEVVSGVTFLSTRDFCRFMGIKPEGLTWEGNTQRVLIVTVGVPTLVVKEDISYKNHDDTALVSYIQKNIDPRFSKEAFEKKEIVTASGDDSDMILTYRYKVGDVVSDFGYHVNVENYKVVGVKPVGIAIYDFAMPATFSLEDEKEKRLEAFRSTSKNKNRIVEERIQVVFASATKQMNYSVITGYETEEGFVYAVRDEI